MKHAFYLKSEKEQQRIQLKIVLLSSLINLGFLSISIFFGIYFLVVFTVIASISIIAPFIDIPSLKKNGKLIYYSPLFVTEKEKKGIIKIHGGSLLDYVYVIDKSLNGKQRTTFIIQQYLEGLLNLIDENEKAQSTSVKLKGTSYIINERTANKIGLKLTKTDFIQKFILLYNYPNILVSNTIAKNKIAFPNLKQIKSFECEINQLIAKKEYIIGLNDRLKNSISN